LPVGVWHTPEVFDPGIADELFQERVGCDDPKQLHREREDLPAAFDG
jgi:hypothetical protein